MKIKKFFNKLNGFNKSYKWGFRVIQATVLSQCIWQYLTGGVITDSVAMWRSVACRWQTFCSSTNTHYNHTTCPLMVLVETNLCLISIYNQPTAPTLTQQCHCQTNTSMAWTKAAVCSSTTDRQKKHTTKSNSCKLLWRLRQRSTFSLRF